MTIRKKEVVQSYSTAKKENIRATFHKFIRRHVSNRRIKKVNHHFASVKTLSKNFGP